MAHSLMVKFDQRTRSNVLTYVQWNEREGTHPSVVELVPLHLLTGCVPQDEDGEGGGCPGSQVSRRSRHRNLRLGGDVQRGAGLAGAVLVVGDNPHAVHGAGEQALQGNLLQGASR